MTNNSYYPKIPLGWALSNAESVSNITMGQSPAGDSINPFDGIEFHQGKLLFGNKILQHSSVRTTQPTKIAKPDSIIMSVRAPVGSLNITDRKICIGRGLCAFEIKAEVILQEYLFYALKYLSTYFENNSTGSTFKAIGGDIVRNAPILLAPFAEQMRIVSTIDELYSLLDEIADSVLK